MEKMKPESDLRYRVKRSTLLWVCLVRNLDKGCPCYEIINGCQRTTYSMEGRERLYIQYDNGWYELHNEHEFKTLLTKARKKEVRLFSNEMGVSSAFPRSLSKLEAKPFILIKSDN